jgi:hypothetical protein
LSTTCTISQNQAQNQNENGGGILTDEGSCTSTQLQVSPPENAQSHAQTIDSGDSGDSGDTLPTLGEGIHGDSNKYIFSKSYVSFDFEWLQESSSTLLTAGFIDSSGNTKALHMSDYSSSANPEAALIKRINQQLLSYDFSIGWYSQGGFSPNTLLIEEKTISAIHLLSAASILHVLVF